MELSFNAPLFLWALPLAALPLWVHLRARARERVVDFPGAFFLESPALPEAEQRRRIEDVLLLSLRCLLLALALIALAGPRLKGGPGGNGGAAADGGGREAVVVVLDDSPSLAQRRDENGAKCLARELKTLAAILAQDPARRVALETASGRARPFLPAAEWAARLPQWLAGRGAVSGDRGAALARARRRLLDTEAQQRVVVLVSDGERNAGEGEGLDLEHRWEAALQSFAGKAAPALIVWQVKKEPKRQWSLDAIRWDDAPGAPVVGRMKTLRVRVRCLSGAGPRRLRVATAPLLQKPADAWGTIGTAPAPSRRTLRTLLERTLVLEEGGVAEVSWPLLAEHPGARFFEARLEEADERPFDDYAAAVIRVRPKREVCLWDLRRGRPSYLLAKQKDSALRALRSGLNPLAGTGKDRVRLRVVAGAVPGAPVPWTTRTVLLVGLHDPDGARLGAALAERLRGAVEEGLRVLWVPDLTSPLSRNLQRRSWPAPAGEPLFPRGFELEYSSGARRGRSWRIGLPALPPPPLAPFRGGRNGDLGGIRFQRRLRLKPPEAGARATLRVWARFDDGLPAFVEKRIGDGSVLQLALGIEPQGGLAGSPAWPVLLANLIEWAARDGLGAVSGLLVHPAGRAPTPWPLPPSPHARRFRLDGPWALGSLGQGGEKALPARWDLDVPARGERLLLPPLSEPGLYRLRGPRRGAERWMTCRIHEAESSGARLPEALQERIAKAARRSGGALVDGGGAFRRALAALRPGRSLRPWLWMIFFAAMALELGVLIARGRSG